MYISGVPPEICVAIPVRNGSDFLSEAIESVLAQEGVDLEVRIRDNLSDDDSVAVAQSYAAKDPRVIVAVNEENVFYYGSLNRIIADTEAEFFVPFAHDDVMLPGNLAKKLDVLRRTGAAFAHSAALHIDEHGTVSGRSPDISFVAEVLDPPALFPHIAPYNRVWPQTVLARTDALRSVGGFDARSLYAGDWLTWMRLALRERVVTLQEPLVQYRVHSGSGHLESNASGFNGRDLPATLDLVFSDPAMPDELRAHRDVMVAAQAAAAGTVLHGDGIRRVAGGRWAGYMTVGRALARKPEDFGLRALYASFARESGLAAPQIPFEAVAPAPSDAGEAAALAAAVEEIGGLLASLAIAVAPDRVDESMALLEPAFGDTDLAVDVIPTADVAELFAAGRLVLARWGSDLVAQAEEAAMPVYPYAMPDPFAEPPDVRLWQALDAAATLG
jgi:hypothetical protein